MSQKLIKITSKTKVKNNTKINQNFHEKLMELMCRMCDFHGKYQCLLKVTIFAKSSQKARFLLIIGIVLVTFWRQNAP